MGKYDGLLETTLEELIDQFGTSAVLGGISQVCSEKAQHIRENWQDEGLARKWDRAAKTADTCAESPLIREIS